MITLAYCAVRRVSTGRMLHGGGTLVPNRHGSDIWCAADAGASFGRASGSERRRLRLSGCGDPAAAVSRLVQVNCRPDSELLLYNCEEIDTDYGKNETPLDRKAREC